MCAHAFVFFIEIFAVDTLVAATGTALQFFFIFLGNSIICCLVFTRLPQLPHFVATNTCCVLYIYPVEKHQIFGCVKTNPKRSAAQFYHVMFDVWSLNVLCFRPIERIVWKTIVNKLFEPYQCGLRPGKSTINQDLLKGDRHIPAFDLKAAFLGTKRGCLYADMSELCIPAKLRAVRCQARFQTTWLIID